MKRKINKEKKIVKGSATAAVITILIHVVMFLLAGILVVFTVLKKEETPFEPPRTVERPKMKLKKPKVKVKQNSRPKSAPKIATTKVVDTMPAMDLPSLDGIGQGLGDGGAGGFGLMPDLEVVSVFGETFSIGNDFEGRVYSLLHARDGDTVPMGRDMFRNILRKYVLSGWKESVLAPYFRSDPLYTTHFMVPPIPTAMAPGFFGEPQLEDYYLFVKYEGQVVYPKDIKFRFWGIGDAYIFVNVGGKEVLLCTWDLHQAFFDWWQSSAGSDRTYTMGNMQAVVGDWIELKAGEPLDMKVMYGEWHGGQVSGMLAVEVEGVDYPTGRGGMPLLPAFKTEEFTWETITEISRFLVEGEVSLTNGPVFNDYTDLHASSDGAAEGTNAPPVESAAAESEDQLPDQWTLVNGRTVTAELVTVVNRNAVMRNPRGKQMKIPMREFSEKDRSMIRLSFPPDLSINFKKTSKQRQFSDTYLARALPVRGSIFTFGAEIKKSSLRPYDFDLTVEYFAIGSEIGGERYVLLDYQKSQCRLSKENNFAFEFSGPPVELLDYEINVQRRGKRYACNLVVVTDKRGRVIAHQTSRESMFRNLENLRKIKPGWYFDDDCNPCLPTPPAAWGARDRN